MSKSKVSGSIYTGLLILWGKPLISLIRQTKYQNKIVEQDHRFIKKITKPNLGFKSFLTVDQTLKGIEALHMIRKGQADDKHSNVYSLFIGYIFHDWSG